jgi:hypothetical protein
VNGYVDPQDGTLPAEVLKAYREAGASRIVLFSQPLAKEVADGNALGVIERVAPVVERAQQV